MRQKRYRRNFKYLLCLITTLLIWCSFSVPLEAAPRLQDTGDKLVIVIDPGHGGTNEGTTSGAYPEKIMTLASAKAMYNELIQFDNVEVYLTRTDDEELSLKQRAKFAAGVDADFLFSIHYNASEYHTMFGSEVWVSCQPPYNAYGYQFGHMQMLEMQEMGLFLRGVKTRINDEGKDYYGVIRESAALSVPAVIIEHCYVDESRDIPFCETEDDWIAFGQADARAVAKYFGLTSTALGIDYSDYANQLPEASEDTRVLSTVRDETSPDVCMLELTEADYDTGEITLLVTATDYDSPLLYYDYSLDGGKTYCPLIPWPDLDLLEGTFTDTFSLPLKIESGTRPDIILRAYNMADLYTESNCVPFLQTFFYDEHSGQKDNEGYQPIEPERHSAGTTTFVPAFADKEETNTEVSLLTFLQICLIFVILLFSVVLIAQTINYHRRKRRRRQRRNDVGDNQYHRR